MRQMALKKIDQMSESSIAYGNKFLDYFPRVQPNPGAENLENSQQLWNRIPKRIPAETQERREIFISDWPEKNDPFTQSDLLESEEEEVQRLISQIKMSLSLRYREKLANRLVTLFKDAKEEDTDSPGIAVNSLRNFIKFLQLNSNLKCPSISLSPEYNIYASWKDECRVFSVHFLPNGDVRFVILKPNYRHPERQIRISGTTTTDILMEMMLPYRVNVWISE